jgi:hypothetical protein
MRFGQPPRALKKARLDNISLVPASLLPYKDVVRRLANNLPRGAILVCLGTEAKTRKHLQSVAAQLIKSGHRVKTLDTTQISVFHP